MLYTSWLSLPGCHSRFSKQKGNAKLPAYEKLPDTLELSKSAPKQPAEWLSQRYLLYKTLNMLNKAPEADRPLVVKALRCELESVDANALNVSPACVDGFYKGTPLKGLIMDAIAKYGQADDILMCLQKNINPNRLQSRQDAHTPLMLAVVAHNAETTRVLAKLATSETLTARNGGGKTALDLAHSLGDKAVLKAIAPAYSPLKRLLSYWRYMNLAKPLHVEKREDSGLSLGEAMEESPLLIT